jgi:hypothetical protein
MRTALIAVSSATFTHPRTPGVILLAHDLNLLISRLIRAAKAARNR